MYQSESLHRPELPTSAQLTRSTLIAAASAAVLLVTVVLPSEYAIDPTGIGRVLGLTDMGEIKTTLAAESAADAEQGKLAAPNAPAAPATNLAAVAPPVSAPADQPDSVSWRDELSFSLAPGEGTEVKLRMKSGERAPYLWKADGGVVNYDAHGDGSGQNISYAKGRGVRSDEGEMVAAFTGNHGWFWRNRGEGVVTVTLRTRGAYADVKRVK